MNRHRARQARLVLASFLALCCLFAGACGHPLFPGIDDEPHNARGEGPGNGPGGGPGSEPGNSTRSGGGIFGFSLFSPSPPAGATPGAFPGDPNATPMDATSRAHHSERMRKELIHALRLTPKQINALEKIEKDNPGDDPGARFIVMSELKKCLTPKQLKTYEKMEQDAPPM
jgi:hypothetical protein